MTNLIYRGVRYSKSQLPAQATAKNLIYRGQRHQGHVASGERRCEDMHYRGVRYRRSVEGRLQPRSAGVERNAGSTAGQRLVRRLSALKVR